MLWRLLHCTRNVLTNLISRQQRLLSDGQKQLTEKNVEVFAFNKPAQFRWIKLFSYSQLAIWTYVLNTSSKIHEKQKTDEVVTRPPGKTFKERLMNDIALGTWRYPASIICAFLGFTIGAVGLFYTLRCVRSIVVMKGGRNVRIVTYAPLTPLRYFDVPIEHVSCTESRQSAVSSIMMRVRGRPAYFILDKRGIFPHPSFFDRTVGMRRAFT